MTLRPRRFLQWVVLAGLVPMALAQSTAVRSGSLEIGPFVGASYGIDKFRVMGGGNVTYALKNKYVLPYFEFSYFPGLPHTSTVAGTVYSYSTGLTDYHGGVHIRMPWFFKEKPLVPYLVIGVGALHSLQTTEMVTFPGRSPSYQTVNPETSFAINGGGGLRYYLGGRGTFGFRVEAKVYKATTGDFSSDTIGKVEAGFFFQIH